MRRLTGPILAAALAAAGALVPAWPVPAAAAEGTTPHSYVNYAFPSPTEQLDNVTYGITVQADPGHANVYWSNQFEFTTHGAYAGLQSHRDGLGMFLFSVWDTTAARPGSPGTYCQAFGGEGIGQSCRLDKQFTVGHHYQFTIAPGDDGWFTATVTDATSNESFELGSIEVGSGAKIKAAGMVNWVEYFDWSNDAATCADSAYSKARFDLPSGNNGTVTASITDTSMKNCTDQTKITTERGFSEHELATGNSASGTITGANGLCVQVASGAPSGTAELGGGCPYWVLAKDGTVHTSFTCLDVTADGAALVAACNGAKSQRWTLSDRALVNAESGNCLDAQGGGTVIGTKLITWTCTGNDNQKWTTPARTTNGSFAAEVDPGGEADPVTPQEPQRPAGRSGG